jgi:cell division septation protein DedD
MVDLGLGRDREEVRDRDLSEDTEITLGTGKLLGIFFGLVLVCSFFFTVGYLFGHSNAAAGKTEIIGTTTPASGSSAGKPAAGDKVAPPSTSSTPTSTPSNQPPPQTQASLSSPPPTPTPPSASPAPSPEIKASANGTYTVQVAAVSKQEDAQSLVSALQKKQYPAFLTNVSGDSLFHVQVGPFSDPKDAETMRSRLAAEGYDAIVKR